MNISNVIKLADLEKIAATLGEEAAKGNDTQVKMAVKIVEGAYHGAIDKEKAKHGDFDDATHLAELYVKSRNKTAMFDARATNQRKLASCFRTLIGVGQWPKGGAGEPLASMNNLVTIWTKERQQPANKGRLDDCFNTIMKWGRNQLKRDTLFEEDELRNFCFKKQAAYQSGEQIIQGMVKQLIALTEGKAAHSTALDNSAHVKKALSELQARLREYDEANKPAASKATKATATA